MILEFLFAAIIIELTPGPNMTWIALIAASKGKRLALSAVLGIAIGLTIAGLIAIFGFSVLIENNPIIFNVLRFAGTIYILYLAFSSLSFSRKLQNKEFEKSSFRYFSQGFVINILNPKAYLFYATVLPQFIDYDKKILSQFITLTIIYIIVATTIHALIAVIAGKFTKFISNPVRAKLISRFFFILLIIVAVWFFFSTK
jgi:threonine/homoserine/homoserine lactone efflux protein